ncbi:hypothetical protein AB6A40_008515 [Gnathostoma spinigerum]|uniref:Uncharacterized protein n=1 Tax=Gnathostoma spinigerum TaxID=75299 RepID=A0ABD6EWD8_9BILA
MCLPFLFLRVEEVVDRQVSGSSETSSGDTVIDKHCRFIEPNRLAKMPFCIESIYSKYCMCKTSGCNVDGAAMGENHQIKAKTSATVKGTSATFHAALLVIVILIIYSLTFCTKLYATFDTRTGLDELIDA